MALGLTPGPQEIDAGVMPQTIGSARNELLRRLDNWLELPMVVLGAIWLLLLLVDLMHGPTPATTTLGTAIWIVFVVEFVLRLVIAPSKLRYLRRQWLTAVSLAIPALRVFRILRVVRVLRVARGVRALRFARVITSFNRGARALGSTMRHRGFPYVVALTMVVLLLGSAAMFAFERDAADAQIFSSFTGSLWWTSMLLTTMGSESWPKSPEGRLVCLLLSIYAFAMFGYITATLASFFVGDDARTDSSHGRKIEEELAALRQAMERLASRPQ